MFQVSRSSFVERTLMTMLGKSNMCTSSGSSMPFLVTMICFGCSSTGIDRISAATCSSRQASKASQTSQGDGLAHSPTKHARNTRNNSLHQKKQKNNNNNTTQPDTTHTTKTLNLQTNTPKNDNKTPIQHTDGTTHTHPPPPPTSSAVFHLASWPRRFCPAHTLVWMILRNSCPVRGLKMKMAPLMGFVVKLPSNVC